MLFSRSSRLFSSAKIDDVRSKLLGQKFNVHNLEFEIQEKDSMLKIIPKTENEEKFRILPITHILLETNGQSTRVSMKSKPRRIDIGGPNLLLIFCIFIFACGAGLYIFNKDEMLVPSLIMMGLSLLMFVILWLNLERGYFDYFRKQKSYVKSILA